MKLSWDPYVRTAHQKLTAFEPAVTAFPTGFCGDARHAREYPARYTGGGARATSRFAASRTGGELTFAAHELKAQDRHWRASAYTRTACAIAPRYTCCGVDILTISQWLGHASVTTTNRYATTDLEMKRKAIEQAQAIDHKTDDAAALWRTDVSVLAWLEAL